MTELRIFEGVPDGLVDCEASALHELLGGPSLIYVGERGAPRLFVSVLLHGNETSGWNALRRLLTEAAVGERQLLIFIGNVQAAAAGLRSLPGQTDFNRLWRDPTQMPKFARQVIAHIDAEAANGNLFAAVDLHNNTGQNPHYSIVTQLSPADLGLAYLFSDNTVLVEEPDSVLTRVFGGRCPAVAVELGPVGDASCEDRAYDFVKRCLATPSIEPTQPGGLSLFRTVARVLVRDDRSFTFADSGADAQLVLTAGIEAVNFHDLPEDTEFGRSRSPVHEVLSVIDTRHQDVTAEYFTHVNGRINLVRSVIPAMYTTDPLVIRQDCLCYFMEKFMPAAE